MVRMLLIEHKNLTLLQFKLIIFIVGLAARSNGGHAKKSVPASTALSSSTTQLPSQICPVCRATFDNCELLATHSLFCHKLHSENYSDSTSHIQRCALTGMNGLLRDYRLWSENEVTDVVRWLRDQSQLVQQCLQPLLGHFVLRGMMYACITVVQVSPTTGEIVKRIERYIPSLRSDQICDVHEWFMNHITRIDATLQKFLNMNGSDWQLERLDFALLKVSLSENLFGRGTFVLPEKLRKMRAVINVDCKNDCFLYAVLSVLHYDDVKSDKNRPSKYVRWLNDLNCEGINLTSVDIARDVPKFERMNDLKINVHVWDRGLRGVVYNSRSNLSPKTVNILLVVKDNEKHYVGVPTLSRLYAHLKSSHSMPFMCERCIQSFKSEHSFHTHYEWCRRGKPQIEIMPTASEYMYRSLDNELSPLRVIYADTECYIEKESRVHVPAAVGMSEVWHKDSGFVSEYKDWCGENCIMEFLTELEKIAKDQFKQDAVTRRSMIISPQQQTDFEECTHCPKCKKRFSQKLYKVRDHCHISGLYRGPLCNVCNCRLFMKRRTIPIIFHNLKNYDCHLILKFGIGKFKHWKLQCIAQSSEKFMSLKARIPVGKTAKGRTIFFTLSFIDSFQFMSSSLATLAENHKTLPYTEALKLKTPSLSDEVLRRKGIFPYSFFSSFEVLNDTTLPPRQAFTNDLTNEECSESNYEHAFRAWHEFGCKTFKDYLMRYLELDVRILRDVFEEFRRMSLSQDGLDPVHYVSLPGLSFHSAFKMTDEKIDLLQNEFLYNLFERGIRGGLTYVNTHHATDRFIQENGQTFRQILMYIDMNSLYADSLSQNLPHSNFHLLTENEIQSLFPSAQHIINLDTESDIGFYFEVDLDYPAKIHHKTSDFPLAPETAQVTEDMLSDYMKDLYKKIMTQRSPEVVENSGSKHCEKRGITKFQPSYKLLLSQNNKRNYCVHFKILKYYLEHGMELKTIHNCVRFTQKAFLRPYIAFNSDRRRQATSKHEKDFYKLKNNCLFGKCLEDVRKHGNYRLITCEKQMKKLIASALFVDRDIITEEIAGVKLLKPRVILNRPIYIGQAVLDHSKLSMYKLFYETLPSCSLIHKMKLLGGDTDSFFLQVTVDERKTAADVLQNLKHVVDFSNYPRDHPLFSEENKARLGCFKDEVAGENIEEMILLKPKMYSMQLFPRPETHEHTNSIRRAKGIGKSIVKNTLRHSDYKNAYEQSKETVVNMTILKSHTHTIRTHTFKKRCLSAFEDKRIWLDANVSLPHGHVDSPVVYCGPKKVKVPPAGDIVAASEQVIVCKKHKNPDENVGCDLLHKRLRFDSDADIVQ